MDEVDDALPRSSHAVPASEAVRDLQRWVRFGGTWRVDSRDATMVTLALCRCDGGEQVDRIVSADTELLAYVAEHLANEDVPGTGAAP